MSGVKVVSTLGVLSLLFGASSCARIQSRQRETDLLATGLIGWQQIGGQEGAWHFEDGVLSAEGENAGWLATHRQYANFRLSAQFRVAPGGNSGIYLRAPLAGDPAYAGLEIQILDEDAPRAGHLEPSQYTGSLYGIQAPADRVSKGAGVWQTMVIVAEGPRLQVSLNGKKVLDTDLTYYSHLADTHPGLVRTSGYIGLQSGGSRIEFRNITILELPEGSKDLGGQ